MLLQTRAINSRDSLVYVELGHMQINEISDGPHKKRSKIFISFLHMQCLKCENIEYIPSCMLACLGYSNSNVLQFGYL